LGGMESQTKAAAAREGADQKMFVDWITIPDTKMRLVFDDNLEKIVTFNLKISQDIMSSYQAHADLCDHLGSNNSLTMANAVFVTGKTRGLIGLATQVYLHRFYWPATFPAYFVQNVLTPPRG
jgi:hypothetical protein